MNAHESDEPCKAERVRKELWDKVWKEESYHHSFIKRSLQKVYRQVILKASPFNFLIRSWLSEKVDLSKSRVLEIGGAGGLGTVLSPSVKSYTLLDFSEVAITRAGRVLHKIPNANYIVGDLFKYVPEEKFDMVISVGLIEHFFGARKEECLRAHIRMSNKYVCIGGPSDIPLNWWRHFRFYATKEFPDQRPVSEKELFDLCLQCNLKPVSMTRIDPTYGRTYRRLSTALHHWYAAYWPSKAWGIDRLDGGLVVMLAEIPHGTDPNQ